LNFLFLDFSYISTLLAGYAIVSVQETQLTAVANAQRDDAIHMESDSAIEAIPVLLQPTEIRTFVVSTKPAKNTDAKNGIHFN
jgi:hypothetical protein